MNDLQRSLWEFICENPGCTYLELSRRFRWSRPTWGDHLSTLTSGNPYGRISRVPKMVVEEFEGTGVLLHQKTRRYWPILGPHLGWWARQCLERERLVASLPEEHRASVLKFLRDAS